MELIKKTAEVYQQKCRSQISYPVDHRGGAPGWSLGQKKRLRQAKADEEPRKEEARIQLRHQAEPGACHAGGHDGADRAQPARPH